MKLYAGVIYYNDSPGLLESCFKALKANGFKIIAVDGAFKEFPLLPNEKYYSTDGCIDVVRKYADIHVSAPKDFWFNQAVKRNQYFKHTPIGSYCFSIDADEIMQPFSWDGIELTEDVYRIKQKRFHEDGTTLMLNTVRGYKMYDDIEYRYRHCTIYRTRQHKEGDLESGLVTSAKGRMNKTRKSLVDKNGDTMLIHNRQDLRPKKRQHQKESYKANRKEWEYRRELNDF